MQTTDSVKVDKKYSHPALWRDNDCNHELCSVVHHHYARQCGRRPHFSRGSLRASAAGFAIALPTETGALQVARKKLVARVAACEREREWQLGQMPSLHRSVLTLSLHRCQWSLAFGINYASPSKKGLYLSTRSASGNRFLPTILMSTSTWPSFISMMLYAFSKKPLKRVDEVVPA